MNILNSHYSMSRQSKSETIVIISLRFLSLQLTFHSNFRCTFIKFEVKLKKQSNSNTELTTQNFRSST